MPMPALPELQRAFARALLDEDDAGVHVHIEQAGFSAAERLDIYRHTCRSTLIEALRMTYPAVDRLVGREFFDMAAGRFAREHPCRSGYLNEYGSGLAEFLAGLESTRGVAYLADVARFEWALGVAANAPDVAPLDPRALAQAHAEADAALRFERHPSLSFLTLQYPADQIADAVLGGDDAAMAQVDLGSGPVRLAVHRGPAGVAAQRLGPRAYEFLSRLCAGEPWGRVVECAPAEAPALLAEALAQGRLSGVRL